MVCSSSLEWHDIPGYALSMESKTACFSSRESKEFRARSLAYLKLVLLDTLLDFFLCASHVFEGVNH